MRVLHGRMKKWIVVQLPINNVAFYHHALVVDGHAGPLHALSIKHEFVLVGGFETCCGVVKRNFYFCDSSATQDSRTVAYGNVALLCLKVCFSFLCVAK